MSGTFFKKKIALMNMAMTAAFEALSPLLLPLRPLGTAAMHTDGRGRSFPPLCQRAQADMHAAGQLPLSTP